MMGCNTDNAMKNYNVAGYESVSNGNTKCKVPTKTCVVSTNDRCGKSYENTICGHGWCSKNNKCGTTDHHKSTHQASYDSVSEGNLKCCKTGISTKYKVLKNWLGWNFHYYQRCCNGKCGDWRYSKDSKINLAGYDSVSKELGLNSDVKLTIIKRKLAKVLG